MTTGITATKVGEALGVSADTVRRHWPHWMVEQGFPRPLFNGGLLRWDADAVERWKARRSDSAAPSTLLEPEPDWAVIARRRGAALDAGVDPDLVA